MKAERLYLTERRPRFMSGSRPRTLCAIDILSFRNSFHLLNRPVMEIGQRFSPIRTETGLFNIMNIQLLKYQYLISFQ